MCVEDKKICLLEIAYAFKSPLIEKFCNFFYVISFALFEIGGVLSVYILTFTVQDYKNRKSETCGISKLLHCFRVFVFWRIVDVYIDKIVVYDRSDCVVGCGKFGKSETPHTPISTNLTKNEFVFFGGFFDGGVYLLYGVDIFVIDFVALRVKTAREQQSKDKQKIEFLHLF